MSYVVATVQRFRKLWGAFASATERESQSAKSKHCTPPPLVPASICKPRKRKNPHDCPYADGHVALPRRGREVPGEGLRLQRAQRPESLHDLAPGRPLQRQTGKLCHERLCSHLFRQCHTISLMVFACMWIFVNLARLFYCE